MSPSSDAPSSSSLSEVLSFTTGQIVQEIGYDDDVDLDLRDAIEDLIGDELEEEDTQEIVDAVVLWWRDGDGDLTDALVDTLRNIEPGAPVWVMNPKAGTPRTRDAGGDPGERRHRRSAGDEHGDPRPGLDRHSPAPAAST